MKFYVENKLITIGGSSSIFDAENNEVYRVKGKIITLTQKKIFKDVEGNVLYKIRNSFIHAPFIHSAFLCTAKGKKILKVKEKVGVGYKIIYGDNDMDIEGKWFSLSSSIKENGNVIATVTRNLNLFVDKFEVETFDVEDPALCLALVICMDNIADKIG